MLHCYLMLLNYEASQFYNLSFGVRWDQYSTPRLFSCRRNPHHYHCPIKRVINHVKFQVILQFKADLYSSQELDYRIHCAIQMEERKYQLLNLSLNQLKCYDLASHLELIEIQFLKVFTTTRSNLLFTLAQALPLLFTVLIQKEHSWQQKVHIQQFELLSNSIFNSFMNDLVDVKEELWRSCHSQAAKVCFDLQVSFCCDELPVRVLVSHRVSMQRLNCQLAYCGVDQKVSHLDVMIQIQHILATSLLNDELQYCLI